MPNQVFSAFDGPGKAPPDWPELTLIFVERPGGAEPAWLLKADEIVVDLSTRQLLNVTRINGELLRGNVYQRPKSRRLLPQIKAREWFPRLNPLMRSAATVHAETKTVPVRRRKS
jgi:hypothetical protein